MGSDYQNFQLHSGNIQYYDHTRLEKLKADNPSFRFYNVEERMQSVSGQLKHSSDQLKKQLDSLNAEKNLIEEDREFIHSYSKSLTGLEGIITRILNFLPRFGVFSKADALINKIEKQKKEIEQIQSQLTSRELQEDYLKIFLSILNEDQKEGFAAAFDAYCEQSKPMLTDGPTTKMFSDKISAIQLLFTRHSSQSDPGKIRFHHNMLLNHEGGKRVQAFLQDLFNNKIDAKAFVATWVRGQIGPIPLDRENEANQRQNVDIMLPGSNRSGDPRPR